MTVAARNALVGRDHEVTATLRLLDNVRERGSALLVCGPAGTGKSSLLNEARLAAAARAMRVVSVTGVRQNAGQPFCGLRQVLGLFGRTVNDLPRPQRDAVRTALELPDLTPNLFFLALGALELLGRAAGRAPLLLIAEDVQWLDPATSEVLAIMAKRLHHVPVVLLAALRAGAQTPLTDAGLAELNLEPLGTEDARGLLTTLFPDLPRTQRDQVLVEAQGNPLALTELPLTLHHAGTALAASGTGHARAPRPLTVRLRRAFGIRDLDLPGPTRELLVIAAASDRDDLSEVLGAASVADRTVPRADVLEAAVRAGLIRVADGAVRFCHPLTRSAVYHEAAPAQRRAAHQALALVVADDPSRWIWHAAATATAPDEAIAGKLELAARQDLQAGAVTDAAAALERAAMFVRDPAARGHHLLRAAELSRDGGQAETARQLVARARSLRLRPTDLGRLAWFDALSDTGRHVDPGGAADTATLHRLVILADHARLDGDPELALRILADAALGCFWAGQCAETRQAILRVVMSVPGYVHRPAALSVLGFADSARQAGVIGAALPGLQQDNDAFAVGAAATLAGDPHSGALLLAPAVTTLRSQGRFGQLARALAIQAQAAAQTGDGNTAITASEEGVRLARETGQPVFAVMATAARLTRAAQTGDRETVAVLVREIELSSRSGYALAIARSARGHSALSAGQWEEAYRHLRPVFERGDPAYHYAQRYWVVADLAEAAARSGHREEGSSYVREVASEAGSVPGPFPQVGLLCAQAFLAADEQEPGLLAALAGGGLEAWPFLRARIQLAQGAWLRGQRRIVESRTPLRSAGDAFAALGCVGWAEQAGRELRAAGDPGALAVGPAAHSPAAASLLSAQELRIARLVASGMSNRQIGERLYLSHRTVGACLYQIFPKLGITSRAQLSEALAGQAEG